MIPEAIALPHIAIIITFSPGIGFEIIAEAIPGCAINTEHAGL